MDSKAVVRKAVTLVALVVIAASVLVLTPPAGRIVIALLALPLEAALIASLIGSGTGRRVPQA